MKRNDSPYNIGAFHEIDPLYSVANQLNIFTADGIETLKVIKEKMMFINGD